MSALQDLQAQRLGKAYTAVERLTKKGTNDQKKINARLRELPAMLLTNGLGSTLAFMMAKGPREKDGVDYWSAWTALCKEVLGTDQVAEVCEGLNAGDSAWHSTKLMEALAYAQCLKRWGEALLANESEAASGVPPSPPDGEEGDGE